MFFLQCLYDVVVFVCICSSLGFVVIDVPPPLARALDGSDLIERAAVSETPPRHGREVR